MQDERLVFCIKISQKEWIEKLQAGSAWFGAINNYIVQAETSNNNEQGDKYEGVFSRCKKDSYLVEEYQHRFGDDLEVIDDDEYCFLRRKSSRQVCAFCMYGIKNTDLIPIGDINEHDGVLVGSFHYDIEPKMYSGFLLDGHTPAEVAGFYCSSGHIINAIETSLRKERYSWRRNMVHYDIDISKEFFIEPKPDYPELFHKRIDLQYQHEMRIFILNAPSGVKGVVIPFEPISVNSGNFALGQLYLEGTATFKKKE